VSTGAHLTVPGKEVGGAVVTAALALVIFGAVYFGGTLALRHPDARRLWTFLR